MSYDGKERRKNNRDIMQAIEDAVHRSTTNAITEHAKISPKKHREHHNWTENKIAKEKKCSERREKIFNTVFGSVGVTIIIGILAGFGAFLKHVLEKWLHNGG